MGFCRHCGEFISEKNRCSRCGGSAAAPAVAFNPSERKDRWSKTYAANSHSSSKQSESRSASPTKRFPRPLSTSKSSSILADPGISSRVSAHIANVYQTRPPATRSSIMPAPEKDILPSPSHNGLAKVYGSVLQPKNTLSSYACSMCSTVFPPDATIYPDPRPSTSLSSPRFLCRPCFIENGGTKGICPGCSRPVLALKTEGQFIETAGNYWHKKCFNCDGCSKNVGNSPMVDLLGRPSCADCLEACLNPRTPRKSATTSPTSNIGGMSIGSKSREGSPAIDELETRLGIMKAKSSSPEPISHAGKTSHSPQFAKKDSPVRAHISNRSFSPSSPSRVRLQSPPSSSPITMSRLRPSTPDLVSDVSDTATHSSGPDSPPRLPEPSSDFQTRTDLLRDLAVTDLREGYLSTPTKVLPPTLSLKAIPPSSNCARCHDSLFAVNTSSYFVSLPDDLDANIIRTFHAECFRCSVCDRPFAEKGKTQAPYTKGERGPCHLECATTQVVTNSVPKGNLLSQTASIPSVKSETPFRRPQENPTSPFPKPGSSCPACLKRVFPMDRGVIPGPQGTRWHASCLVCGGNLKGQARKQNMPGCGKRCDSNARYIEGVAWCVECSLLLPSSKRGGSPQGSPTRSTGGMAAQYTGTTTLARQFTGMGTAEGTLLRQMTGGGLSPTRSLSPTKQLSTRLTGMGTAEGVLLRQMTGGGLSPTRSLSPTKQLSTRPRPKSVAAMRPAGL